MRRLEPGATAPGGAGATGLRRLTEERYAWVWLAIAMAIAAAVALWLGRGTTFWVDELTWFMEAPEFGLKTALEPHLGHLVLTSHVVYQVGFELFGSSYLPYRVLAVLTLLVTVLLFFVLVRRRTNGFVALAPSLLLLFFGSDYFHILTGNTFTVLGAIALGLGAFLALERGDRRGDVLACVLLSLAVVTYSVALGFLLGAAVWVLLDRDLKRVWIFAVPAVIYGSWWLWTRTLPPSAESNFAPDQILLFPAWAFQTTSAMLQAATGLSYQFENAGPAASAGPVLVIAVLLALGRRVLGGRVPNAFWGAVGILVGLWAIGSVTAGGIRYPENARYFYPVGIGLALVAAEALRGRRWERSHLVALYLVALAGVCVNIYLLRDGSNELRHVFSPSIRANVTAIELADGAAKPEFGLGDPGAPLQIEQSPLGVPFRVLEDQGRNPTRAYLTAARSYGGIGYSVAELEVQSDADRAATDSMLAVLLGLALEPVEAAPDADSCERIAEGADGVVRATLPPGGAVLSAERPTGSLALGRFASGENVDLGAMPGTPAAALEIPEDRSSDPWRVSIAADALIVCPLA